MNDHQLGSRLRQQILADLQRGIDRDGRGLQALVGDFCGDDELPLLPALRYLVLSPAFTNALGQTPPLAADTALQLRLQRELEPMFSRAICQRMGMVVGGLLALPEPSVAIAEPRGAGAPARPLLREHLRQQRRWLRSVRSARRHGRDAGGGRGRGPDLAGPEHQAAADRQPGPGQPGEHA